MHFIDLQSQYAALQPAIDARIREVFGHGKFIAGPEVHELQSALQEFLGIKHAITCGNGTDALVLGLRALGIGRGDAVFCPTFTFFATAEAIVTCGAIPVFVDCETDSFNICPASLEEAIQAVIARGSHPLKAVVTVDLFGLPANFPAISTIASAHGLKILEDAAQGFGGEINSVKAGNFGDIGVTSFFPSKPLGCYGDGGAVFTKNDDYASIVSSLAHHGKGQNKYDNVLIGMNSRLDTLQAAILLEKLQVFAREVQQRNAVADQYSMLLEGVVDTPVVPTGFLSSWAQYTIKSDRRDAIKKHLDTSGIPSMIYYPKCMHQQEAFLQDSDSYLAPVDLSRSETLASEVLSLPMHPYLESESIAGVCEGLKAALA